MARIASIVLAAGTSGRMGTLKPLLDFAGKPMLARVIESIMTAGGIAPVILVTGHRAAEVAGVAELYKDQVTVAHNPDFATGEMLSSIRAGIAALRPETDGFLLALGDQPAVQPKTIRTLLGQWNDSPLTIPTYRGKRGHPLIISATLIPPILALPRDQTLRNVVHQHLAQSVQIPVDDPAIVADIDTPEDYQHAMASWKQTQKSSA